MDELAREADQFLQTHHSAADHEVELLLHVFASPVQGADVLQPKGFGHSSCDLDLLANTIDQQELAFGEENRQRDAGETTARAEVEDMCPRLETYHLCDAQRVEDVVLVEGIDVLARDDIDLRIPVAIEGVKLGEVLYLLGGEVGKVAGDEVDRRHIRS